MRPWTPEGLLAARVLVAANASLAAVGDTLHRLPEEVDRALWALVGRTPEQALRILNPENVGADRNPLELQIAILTQLEQRTSARTLCEVLDVGEAVLEAHLTDMARQGLVDRDDPPPPATLRFSETMWWRTRAHA